MKYAKQDYIDSGFYDGDDSEISCHKISVVKCRKEHKCNGGCDTIIKVGEYALSESGFMDGEPVSCYTCILCLEEWMDEIGEFEEVQE